MTPKEFKIDHAKNYARRLTEKLSERDWHPKRAHIESARNQIHDLVQELEKKDVPYEQQLRDCLRDFQAIVSSEIEDLRPIRSKFFIEKLECLVRDAENILNREDNSYGKK